MADFKMGILRRLVINLLFYSSLLCLFSTYFLTYYNNGTWLINILAYLIPLFLLFSVAVSIGLIFFKRYLHSLFIIIGLLFLTKPISETFSLGYLTSDKAKPFSCPLNVLTFNVSTFNNHRTEAFMEDDSLFKTKFFQYLKKAPDELDLLCLQEFHHDDKDKQRIIDEIVKITGASYYYTVPIWIPWNGGFFGLITFSKYPIVNKGTLFIGSNELNRGIYTDILYQKDTLRVINLHLHSMNIRWNNEDTTLEISDKVQLVLKGLKEGSEISKFQIDQVLQAIDSSPYEIILCGDFNTFPYGYSYQQVKKVLNNSFEKSGKGFGFSLNIPPYAVRLDNQFSSERIVPIESKVIRSIQQSDHFPLVVKYNIYN